MELFSIRIQRTFQLVSTANVNNTTYDYNLGHISYRYFGEKRLQAQRFQQFIPTFQLFTF